MFGQKATIITEQREQASGKRRGEETNYEGVGTFYYHFKREKDRGGRKRGGLEAQRWGGPSPLIPLVSCYHMFLTTPPPPPSELVRNQFLLLYHNQRLL